MSCAICRSRPRSSWAATSSCLRVRHAVTRLPIRPLAVVAPDRTLADLLLTMRRESRHILLVSDGRRPLGVITLDDVLHAVVGEPAGAAVPVPVAAARVRP